MRWTHPRLPGRALRLAYCLNLHPAEDLDGIVAGLDAICVPLAQRLGHAAPGQLFGVGPWLPGRLALDLAGPGADPGGRELGRLVHAFGERRLDPFTWNAFPFGGFHRPGLKRGVFRPTWKERERLEYSLAVARIAVRCVKELELDEVAERRHVSISTHTGGFGAELTHEDDWRACASQQVDCARALAALEDETGVRVVLSLEPEPRAVLEDTAALAGYWEVLHARVPPDRLPAVRRHLGTCLDACHAAVEFEPDGEAVAHATHGGAPLGKLQFSSALRLLDPDRNTDARERLLEMDEPVYLHQVTGARGADRPRVDDLPDLRAALDAGDPDWIGCNEWRCHFHVPVDLGGDFAGLPGLETTRELADALLERVSGEPELWGTDELHLEIETYTWDVLPGEARGPGALVDGLEREYGHVRALLGRLGWGHA